MKLIKNKFDLYAMMYPPTKEEILDIEALLKDTLLDEKISLGNKAIESFLGEHPMLPYDLDEEAGLLVIPVQGVLLGGIDCTIPGWFCGYEYIRAALSKASKDDRVRAVVLEIDSPGGTVHGCRGASDSIKNFSKPILSASEGLICSGAMWLASSSDSIWVTRYANVGSVGVIAVHFSFKEAYEKEGITPTIVYAGKGKKKLNPYEKLSDEDLDYFQKSIDLTYRSFVRKVSEGCGISEEKVISNGAEVFTEEDLEKSGYVDKVFNTMDELSNMVYSHIGTN